MNNKNTTEQGDIPEFINLDEYNNLLCELKHVDTKQLDRYEIIAKIQAPEIVSETLKIIAIVFYRISVDRYLQHCIFSTIMADVDRLFCHHESYKGLYELLKKIDSEV